LPAPLIGKASIGRGYPGLFGIVIGGDCGASLPIAEPFDDGGDEIAKCDVCTAGVVVGLPRGISTTRLEDRLVGGEE